MFSATVAATALALQVATAAPTGPTAGTADTAAFDEIVETDWTAQEKRRGRTPQDPQAIRDVLLSAGRLLEDLERMPDVPDLAPEAGQLESRVLDQNRPSETLPRRPRLAAHDLLEIERLQLREIDLAVTERPTEHGFGFA